MVDVVAKTWIQAFRLSSWTSLSTQMNKRLIWHLKSIRKFSSSVDTPIWWHNHFFDKTVWYNVRVCCIVYLSQSPRKYFPLSFRWPFKQAFDRRWKKCFSYFYTLSQGRATIFVRGPHYMCLVGRISVKEVYFKLKICPSRARCGPRAVCCPLLPYLHNVAFKKQNFSLILLLCDQSDKNFCLNINWVIKFLSTLKWHNEP